MKNKQGFTLVELLAVLVIISLLMVLVVPQVQKISYNSKIKLCNTKIELTINALNTWSENNPNCFTNTTGCNILTNCTTSNNKTTCETTFDKIAQKGIISYDEDNKVLNPITNKGMNNHEITITYNQSNKTANTQINTTNICSKNIEDIYVDPEDKTTTTSTTTTTTNTTTSTTTTKKTEVTDNLLTTYIKSLDKDNNGLKEDDYGNLRYVGSSPKNRITFNDEEWRIIGIFGDKVKIIKQDRITDADGNKSTQWNSTTSNDWTTSSLKEYLNGTYYNSLTSTAKTQIAEVTWNLGGYTTSDVSAKDMYTYERGKTVYSGRPTTWTGKIALMYPSDYGYASNDETCLKSLFECSSAKYQNWIYTSQSLNDSYYDEWYLSPYSSVSGIVYFMQSAGYMYKTGSYTHNKWSFRPTLYLKSNIKITSGTGTSSSPFQVSL